MKNGNPRIIFEMIIIVSWDLNGVVWHTFGPHHAITLNDQTLMIVFDSDYSTPLWSLGG